nr:MAG TPA: tail fiber protein [Caudoviricetes sp.]
MSAVITPFEGTELFNTASFNNRISQINTGFSYVSNPNLLDNWYFGNPINQRRQTSYTSNGYAVDRWFFDSDSGSCSLAFTKDGVKFIATAGATGIASLKQDIDPTMLSALAGKTVTLSLLGKTDISQQVLFYVNSKVASFKSFPAVNGVCMTTLTYTFPAVLGGATIFVYGRAYSGAGEGTIIAAKLELGSTQSLAHQDAAGNWVLNEIPDYGEQLRRCQRYFYRFNSHAYGWTYNNNIVNCLIPLPVTLRATPVITLYESGTINTVTGDAAMSSYEVKNIASNGLIIDLHNTANAFTTGTPVVWHNFDMAISADL